MTSTIAPEMTSTIAPSTEELSMWVRHPDVMDGAWVHCADGADRTVLNASSVVWEDGHYRPTRCAVLGGRRLQHIVVLPSGITPRPEWIGADCHIDGTSDEVTFAMSPQDAA